MDKVLTHIGEKERSDFIDRFGYDGNCSCHLHPPCASCTHPGNPLNQAEDESVWQDEWVGLDELEARARKALADSILANVHKHLLEMGAFTRPIQPAWPGHGGSTTTNISKYFLVKENT